MVDAVAANEVQALLRFLSQDAKIPLADALSKVKILRDRGLTSAHAIARTDASVIKEIFVAEKVSRSVLSAAKRSANPRKRMASPSVSMPTKKYTRTRRPVDLDVDLESSLVLPCDETPAEELMKIEIETNRAPLFLAFAVTALKYTMPEQPLSSRFSLAQAVVSANSHSKAKSIGLTTGNSAEDDGWAVGQPKVRILNREVAVLRRYIPPPAQETDSQETVGAEDSTAGSEGFWALDLEALRKSNGPLVAGESAVSCGPPVHRPEAARAYLLKSFSIVEKDASDKKTASTRNTAAAEISKQRERAAAMTLRAIDLLCASWALTLSKYDLDRRAWSWYVIVRPEVQQGQAGWGQRGRLKLSDILNLRPKV